MQSMERAWENNILVGGFHCFCMQFLFVYFPRILDTNDWDHHWSNLHTISWSHSLTIGSRRLANAIHKNSQRATESTLEPVDPWANNVLFARKKIWGVCRIRGGRDLKKKFLHAKYEIKDNKIITITIKQRVCVFLMFLIVL